MAFLPSGEILVTELPGRLRTVRNGVLDPTPIAGTRAGASSGARGLEDLALHPKFAENGFVNFTYHKPPPPTNGKSVGSVNVGGAAMRHRRLGVGTSPVR